MLGLSSLVILVAFQNCGQPGSVQLASDGVAPQKLGAAALPQQDPPLVVDVVAAIDDSKAPTGATTATPIKGSEAQPPVATAPAPVPKSADVSIESAAVMPPQVNNVEEVLEDHSCGEDGRKVLVCHFPPGNPAGMHTICIARPALKAHMNHGHSAPEHQDHVGACQ